MTSSSIFGLVRSCNWILCPAVARCSGWGVYGQAVLRFVPASSPYRSTPQLPICVLLVHFRYLFCLIRVCMTAPSVGPSLCPQAPLRRLVLLFSCFEICPTQLPTLTTSSYSAQVCAQVANYLVLHTTLSTLPVSLNLCFLPAHVRLVRCLSWTWPGLPKTKGIFFSILKGIAFNFLSVSVV